MEDKREVENCEAEEVSEKWRLPFKEASSGA